MFIILIVQRRPIFDGAISLSVCFDLHINIYVIDESCLKCIDVSAKRAQNPPKKPIFKNKRKTPKYDKKTLIFDVIENENKLNMYLENLMQCKITDQVFQTIFLMIN